MKVFKYKFAFLLAIVFAVFSINYISASTIALPEDELECCFLETGINPVTSSELEPFVLNGETVYLTRSFVHELNDWEFEHSYFDGEPGFIFTRPYYGIIEETQSDLKEIGPRVNFCCNNMSIQLETTDISCQLRFSRTENLGSFGIWRFYVCIQDRVYGQRVCRSCRSVHERNVFIRTAPACGREIGVDVK